MSGFALRTKSRAFTIEKHLGVAFSQKRSISWGRLIASGNNHHVLEQCLTSNPHLIKWNTFFFFFVSCSTFLVYWKRMPWIFIILALFIISCHVLSSFFFVPSCLSVLLCSRYFNVWIKCKLLFKYDCCNFPNRQYYFSVIFLSRSVYRHNVFKSIITWSLSNSF